jgi:hypothetical protein
MGAKPGAIGLSLHITGRSYGRVPITFQVMSLPQTSHALKLEFNPPHEPRGPLAR